MANKNFQMKANTATGWDNLFPKTNIEQVEGLQALLSTIEAIAKGAAVAMSFDTVAALDTWIAVAANKAKLKIGDVFYIKAKDVPDYWWDGTQKQELETQKIVLALATASIDGLMSKADFTKLQGIATGATKVTAPGDIGAAAASHNHDVNYEPKIATKNTAFNVNFEATPSNIKANGTAAVGSLTTAARADHVHPSDSTKASTAVATTGANGLMSKEDKVKLDSAPVVTTGATAPTSPKVGDIWYDYNN